MMGAFTPHSQTMSEEQLKAAETEATAEQEEVYGQEISEDDLEGVNGGNYKAMSGLDNYQSIPAA